MNTLTTEEQCKIACLQVEQEANQMVNGLKEALACFCYTFRPFLVQDL